MRESNRSACSKAQGLGSSLEQVVLMLSLLLITTGLMAGPGDLDPSFGGGYIVGAGVNLGIAVTTQADGKVLVTGRRDNSDDDLVVGRYHADGMLDLSFGNRGLAEWDGGDDDLGRAIVVQPDGRIVVVGTANNGADDDLIVVRFNTDGSLDGSFGIGGVVIVNGGSLDMGYAVALQPDGRIVAAGRSFLAGSNDFLLIRLNSDGTPDNSFNGVGVVRWDNGGNTESALGLALQPDGRIVAVGYSNNLGDSDVAVVRFGADGTLDNSFGTNGVLLWGGADEDRAEGVALQPDGRILVTGVVEEGIGNWDLLAMRLNVDGTLDGSFDGDGIVTWGGGNQDMGIDVMVQDGRIVVAGGSHNGSDNDAVLVGFTSDGMLDSSFAQSGVFTWDRGSSGLFHASFLQSDGKILAVGGTFGHHHWDLLLARFDGMSVVESVAPVPTLRASGLVALVLLILLPGLYAAGLRRRVSRSAVGQCGRRD